MVVFCFVSFFSVAQPLLLTWSNAFSVISSVCDFLTYCSARPSALGFFPASYPGKASHKYTASVQTCVFLYHLFAAFHPYLWLESQNYIIFLTVWIGMVKDYRLPFCLWFCSAPQQRAHRDQSGMEADNWVKKVSFMLPYLTNLSPAWPLLFPSFHLNSSSVSISMSSYH